MMENCVDKQDGYRSRSISLIKKRKLFNFSNFLALLVALLAATNVQAAIATDSMYDDSLAKARHAYQYSQYTEAKSILDQASEKMLLDEEVKPETRLAMADLYLSLGFKSKTIELLQTLLPGKEASDTSSLQALVHDRLGVAYHGLGDYRLAHQHLKTGLDIAHQLNDAETSAILLNDLGSLNTAFDEMSSAEKNFRLAYSKAKTTGKSELIVRSGINLARINIKQRRQAGLKSLLDEMLRRVDALSSTDAIKLDSLLNIGDLYRAAQIRFKLNAQWRKQAFKIFNSARTIATNQNNPLALSYALGYLGQLYEDENRLKEALHYTRKASFSAQEADARESLYRWTWQTARLLRKQGKIKKALPVYRQTIKILAEIKQQLVQGSPDAYRRRIAPLYIEYADLLLTESGKSNGKQSQQYLKEIRNTLENAKMAEMADHFNSSCLQQVAETKQLDVMTKESAIIYPILLKDRTEVLVSLPEGMKHFKVKVGYKQLAKQVIKLRKDLESYQQGADYKTSAQQLYKWLISPIEKDLRKQGVKTLVFVPDGPLRSIPMSALYDGKQFLVEKYAIATTPSLFLTDPKPIERDKVQILLGGLTESVQGFPALPNVAKEIKKISQMYPSKVYQDQDFVLDNIEAEMAEGSYSIVHVATHAQFDRDHEKSFLLAYDDKMTMDRIEDTIGVRKYTKAPLEMLVMSACQTAAGDDKAALGLAGVAVKAGARSALATLWFISDEATATLIGEFYTQLKNKQLSKAQALRNAQLSLINDQRYQHPSYWAPFLMIGNWL